ncbi:MAG: VanZ family protein [Phycisphaeraceae bacterium]|nr:VanZ family protein [Phycisphaeraceae bacterium]
MSQAEERGGILPRLRVTVFAAYAVLLFTMTHWPRLELPPVVQRPDLIVHFGAFGLWALLLNFSGLVGPFLSRRTAMIAFPISLAYAAIDEGLQAIPFVHRQCALDDWLANAGGVTIVTIGLLVVARRAPPAAAEARATRPRP